MVKHPSYQAPRGMAVSAVLLLLGHLVLLNPATAFEEDPRVRLQRNAPGAPDEDGEEEVSVNRLEGICATDFCHRTAYKNWDDLDRRMKDKMQKAKWNPTDWNAMGENFRWYYLCRWHDLSPRFQVGMTKLGWTPYDWARKYVNLTTSPGCVFKRPLVELRPWNRLTQEERDIAASMGFNEYSWFTKGIDMAGWQSDDGVDARKEDLKRRRAAPAPNFDFDPIKLTLNLPELEKVTWDTLEKSTELIYMEDPDAVGELGNDELVETIKMPMRDFVQGIKAGKPYYIKFENGEQNVISDILGDDVTPRDVLTEALENTTVGERGRLGREYKTERGATFVQLYVGGKNSVTNMHLDVQSFNFLYVAAGRKRVRLLPNDQRYAKNFTWGLEAHYSVWTGYDLLHADPMPEHAVEIILEAGQGVSIPYMTWHAVENLEPTIAFGLIRDFPYTQSKKWWCEDKESDWRFDAEEEDEGDADRHAQGGQYSYNHYHGAAGQYQQQVPPQQPGIPRYYENGAQQQHYYYQQQQHAPPQYNDGGNYQYGYPQQQQQQHQQQYQTHYQGGGGAPHQYSMQYGNPSYPRHPHQHYPDGGGAQQYTMHYSQQQQQYSSPQQQYYQSQHQYQQVHYNGAMTTNDGGYQRQHQPPQQQYYYGDGGNQQYHYTGAQDGTAKYRRP